MSGFAGKTIDASILARARRGDLKAHEIIYRTFADAVYTLALRMLSSPSAAEDVLQETFLEVLRSLHQFRGDARPATWIRRIAVSKCLMQLRSPWHRRGRLFGHWHEVEAALPADTGTRDDGLGRDLDKALARLPAASRAVVWLHDVEGYTHREIGRLMGRSTSFSKSQLARAHRRLARDLGDDFLGDESGVEAADALPRIQGGEA